uniref:Reverse transcriptase zinc-binding domain-containing protein n=1 Tax=Quercus lobata TaxID=97700 RepID=A0A7N2QZ21_QUELO
MVPHKAQPESFCEPGSSMKQQTNIEDMMCLSREGCVGLIAWPSCWEAGEGSGIDDSDMRLEFVLPSTGVGVGLIYEANFVGLTDLGFHEAEKQSEVIPSLDVGVGLSSEADLRVDGGFVVVPPVMGLLMSFSVLELAEMLRRQQSLGLNLFSLLFELGYDSNDAVAPRQFWEDPFLIKKEVEQVLHVRLLLLCFQVVTGLKVNVAKSEMVPIGEINNVQALAEILGYRVRALPMTYLGMPLGAPHKSPSIWNPILEKFERKLAGRKKLYLSKGGRLTLLKTLYNFAANKEAFVESSLICQGAGDRRTWDVRFIRGPNDWEADVVDDFFRFLASNLPFMTNGMGENNDQRFGSYVGFPIACCESQYIAFFQKLERLWEKQVVSTQGVVDGFEWVCSWVYGLNDDSLGDPMMGFGAKWGRWMKACFATVWFSVLVNGCLAGFFGSSRGLYQGDLLSPLLFLLVMQVLSRLLKITKEAGSLRGFQVGRVQGAITGLKVNVGKGEIVPVGEVKNLNALARVLCYQYAYSRSKEAWISDLIVSTSEGGERSWNLQFRRAPYDWELEAIGSLFELLYSCMPRGGGEDKLSWKLTPNDVFDVRSFYNFLFGDLTVVFPWKSIRYVKVPKRVSFFLWTAAKDGILIIDNLVKRGQSLVNWCCMCQCDGESIDHLLLHYQNTTAFKEVAIIRHPRVGEYAIGFITSFVVLQAAFPCSYITYKKETCKGPTSKYYLLQDMVSVAVGHGAREEKMDPCTNTSLFWPLLCLPKMYSYILLPSKMFSILPRHLLISTHNHYPQTFKSLHKQCPANNPTSSTAPNQSPSTANWTTSPWLPYNLNQSIAPPQHNQPDFVKTLGPHPPRPTSPNLNFVHPGYSNQFPLPHLPPFNSNPPPKQQSPSPMKNLRDLH